MPYKVEKRPKEGTDKDWAILKKESGKWKIVGRSTSKEKAKESIKARYANE